MQWYPGTLNRGALLFVALIAASMAPWWMFQVIDLTWAHHAGASEVLGHVLAAICRQVLQGSRTTSIQKVSLYPCNMHCA